MLPRPDRITIERTQEPARTIMSDSQSRPQDLTNHRAMPRLFMAVGAVLLIEELRRLWQAFAEPGWGSAWSVVVGLALLSLWALMRLWALRLQDRVIRAEMHARLAGLLGPQRQSAIADLRLSQLIALRFASDAELPALFEQVIAGELSSADDIKGRITDWRADWHRV